MWALHTMWHTNLYMTEFWAATTVTAGIIWVSCYYSWPVTCHTCCRDISDELVGGVVTCLLWCLPSGEGCFSNKRCKLYQCQHVGETLCWTLPSSVIIRQHLLSLHCFAVRGSVCWRCGFPVHAVKQTGERSESSFQMSLEMHTIWLSDASDVI